MTQPEGLEPADDGELLQLNRTVLLASLQRVKQSETLAALRDELEQIMAQLQTPDSALSILDADDTGWACSSQYLHGELEQIGAALTLERAVYYCERLLRAIQEERHTALNDINLNRWKDPKYDDILTDSLWLIDRRDGSGVHTADYWGNFIPQIPNQLMRRYTRPGEWVIDLFAGLGTSLIEGQRLGRNVLGVELQAQVAARARALLDQEANHADVVREIIEGDSSTVDLQSALAQYGQQAVQLLILHPPYFDIIKFSDDPRDLSNSDSVEHFIAMLTQVVVNAAPLLERGRMLALVIGDKYARGEWIPLGFQAMQAVMAQGFALKSIVVKNIDGTAGKRTRRELWRYRALVGGFYVFKHEYLFVFRKV